MDAEEGVTNATASVEVRRWIDPPARCRSSDEWPYPDEHIEYLITGHLADLIRNRAQESGEVFFDGVCISGGYSEWTQENDYAVTIRVGNFEQEFDGQVRFGGQQYGSALPAIQQWLEEEA